MRGGGGGGQNVFSPSSYLGGEGQCYCLPQVCIVFA